MEFVGVVPTKTRGHLTKLGCKISVMRLELLNLTKFPQINKTRKNFAGKFN